MMVDVRHLPIEVQEVACQKALLTTDIQALVLGVRKESNEELNAAFFALLFLRASYANGRLVIFGIVSRTTGMPHQQKQYLSP